MEKQKQQSKLPKIDKKLKTIVSLVSSTRQANKIELRVHAQTSCQTCPTSRVKYVQNTTIFKTMNTSCKISRKHAQTNLYHEQKTGTQNGKGRVFFEILNSNLKTQQRLDNKELNMLHDRSFNDILLEIKGRPPAQQSTRLYIPLEGGKLHLQRIRLERGV